MVFKKKRDDLSDSNQTSDIWNISQGFVLSHILQPLTENRKLIKIAKFGVEQLDLVNIQIPLDYKLRNRLEALQRLHLNLEDVWNSANFNILKKDLPNWNHYKQRLVLIEEQLDNLTDEKFDQRSGSETLTIKEEKFKKCFNKLKGIESNMKLELNNCEFIFSQSEDTDIDGLINRYIEGG